MQDASKPAETREQLIAEIQSMQPWHHNIPLTEDFSTGMAFSETGEMERNAENPVSLLSLTNDFDQIISQVYPDGLAGKRFLDCACNAGVYCFAARALGAEFSFGFDAREHWIKQANWVKAHRTIAPTDRIRFSVCNLYDLDQIELPMFDIAMFKGIFYHLPDPVTGLQKASDLTRELLIFNTQTHWDKPDGYFAPGLENVEKLMSGVHGLNWRPTGPRAMIPILKYLGYCEARLSFHIQNQANPKLGRMELYASKLPGLLKNVSGEWLYNKV